MSELIAQQQRFALAIARLIIAADSRGMRLRLSHAWRDPRVYKIIEWAFANGYYDGQPKPKCHPRSLHFDRIALDAIAEKDEYYEELHNLWETISDESAPRIEDDLGHFSFARGGMT